MVHMALWCIISNDFETGQKTKESPQTCQRYDKNDIS